MKSIREFIIGKIRRSEVEDLVPVETDGAPHPDLFGFESEVEGMVFYELGMVAGDQLIRYEDISEVALSPLKAQQRDLGIMLADGTRCCFKLSDASALIVHASLRWIGHTRLRRNIAQ